MGYDRSVQVQSETKVRMEHCKVLVLLNLSAHQKEWYDELGEKERDRDNNSHEK